MSGRREDAGTADVAADAGNVGNVEGTEVLASAETAEDVVEVETAGDAEEAETEEGLADLKIVETVEGSVVTKVWFLSIRVDSFQKVKMHK